MADPRPYTGTCYTCTTQGRYDCDMERIGRPCTTCQRKNQLKTGTNPVKCQPTRLTIQDCFTRRGLNPPVPSQPSRLNNPPNAFGNPPRMVNNQPRMLNNPPNRFNNPPRMFSNPPRVFNNAPNRSSNQPGMFNNAMMDNQTTGNHTIDNTIDVIQQQLTEMTRQNQMLSEMLTQNPSNFNFGGPTQPANQMFQFQGGNNGLSNNRNTVKTRMARQRRREQRNRSEQSIHPNNQQIYPLNNQDQFQNEQNCPQHHRYNRRDEDHDDPDDDRDDGHGFRRNVFRRDNEYGRQSYDDQNDLRRGQRDNNQYSQRDNHPENPRKRRRSDSSPSTQQPPRCRIAQADSELANEIQRQNTKRQTADQASRYREEVWRENSLFNQAYERSSEALPRADNTTSRLDQQRIRPQANGTSLFQRMSYPDSPPHALAYRPRQPTVTAANQAAINQASGMRQASIAPATTSQTTTSPELNRTHDHARPEAPMTQELQQTQTNSSQIAETQPVQYNAQDTVVLGARPPPDPWNQAVNQLEPELRDWISQVQGRR